MAKCVNVALALALSVVVVCASVFIGVSGARYIDRSHNSPAEAPLPEKCRIKGPCAEFVANLIVSKALPSKKDVACCRKILQNTKYCWEKIMEILEDPNIPPFANLHPWAENAWDKCVNLTSSPSQAAMMIGNSSTEAPKWPEQCRISQSSIDILKQLLATKTLPSLKDVQCCQEVVQTSKVCWETTIEFYEDPNVPDLDHLHPWAESVWNQCLTLINKQVQYTM